MRTILLSLLAILSVAALLAWGQPAGPVPDISDLDIESGAAGQVPPGWHVTAPGWKAELTSAQPDSGALCAKLYKAEASDAPFGNLMRGIDAKPYQGKRIALTARLRVEGQGQAQMWLRVDRPNRKMGAFDNMDNRPVTSKQWVDALIELDIEPDAQRLALGFMSVGGATIFVDSVKLTVGAATLRQGASEPRPLTDRGLENLKAASRLLSYVRFFHPSDQAVAVRSWDALAVRMMEEAEPAADAPDLAARLQQVLEPVAPTLVVWASASEGAPTLPVAPESATQLARWEHSGAGTISVPNGGNVYASTVAREPVTVSAGQRAAADCFLLKSLGGGVSCRLPVMLYANASGTFPQLPVQTCWSSADGQPLLTADNRSTRLAAVALCWGVMQNFYPYFDVVQTDWEEALTAGLARAATDADDSDFLHTLNALIAKLHDGHGSVFNPAIMPTSLLPVSLAWAGQDLVIAGKTASVPGPVTVGDVLVSLNGRPIADVCDDLSAEISAASEGWKKTRLLDSLATSDRLPDSVPARLRHPDGAEYDVTLAKEPRQMVPNATAKRPANGAQLAPGIVYFNLNGADTSALDAVMPDLDKALGIVFDLRGYPGSGGYALMQHLIDTEATSARWNIPLVTLPDHEGWTYPPCGRWQLVPQAPRLKGKIAFLTDGRAISYAESIMGIVEAYKMGEIVGSTTAGTNGNVNPFTLPGGYTVSWTGMQVLKHDGSRHHGVGIRPTVPVVPTAQGIAQGRDEVLEKAIAVLQSQTGVEGK